MSFVWKVEDMALMNEKSNIYIGNEKIYNAENKLTRQEKIDFLDSMNDGLTSYILNLADKLKEDKENGVIKKDTYGEMKAISYIAWINRNDTRNCIGNSTYNRGEIRFSPCRNINRLDTNVSMFRSSTYSDYVNEAFHLQLKTLENQEKQYFREHDEYEILKTKVSKYSDKYGTFGLNIWKTGRGLYFYKNDDANSAERQITLDELKLLNNKYEEMDKLYAKITAELSYIDYDHEYKTDKDLDYDTVHEESEEEDTTITEVVEDYLDKSEIDLD